MTLEQQKKFKYWQWRTIAGTMIGYIFFYLIRKNFSFLMPGLTAEYGISKTSLGAVITAAGFLYGLSKLLNGMLADRVNGRWHMVTGLAVSTVTAILIGFGAEIITALTGVPEGSTPEFVGKFTILLSALWIVNNIFQGCGFPPCSRLIPRWVPSNELSTKMSIWNTSHSIGAGLAGILCGSFIMASMGTDMSADPAMVATIAGNLGKDVTDPAVISAAEHVGAWKWAFIIPGIIAAVGVFITAGILRDTPKSVGLPELEEGKKDGEPEVQETQAEISAYITKHVWKNPVIWALALADFFVYVIRFAVLDWGPTFLREHCAMSPEWAASTVIIFELFGVVGMLVAGWISDKVFGGRATRTCLFCMLGTLVAILGFIGLQTAGASPIMLLFVLATAGMFIYGPQALIGVIASNHATRKASATANGLVGFVSYISPIVSGLGFGMIADSKFGWHGVFVAMVVMAIIGALIFVPMWKMKRDAYEE
jgi:OPA family glycerol-3-phosphate transporter-like MFS transporter/OPA family sugar phosphate sensor protein UhpC-like MFS transporter